MTAADIVRLLVSLVLVVGGLLVLRWWSQRGRGRMLGRTASTGRVPIKVIGRAGLARGASVAVIEVGTQRFLVGASEHSVSLLSELAAGDPSELGAGAFAPGPVTASGGRSVAIDDDPSVPVVSTVIDGGAPQRLEPSPSPGPGSSITALMDAPDGPRMGLVARLQQMTLRAPDRRPSRAVT
jgi:Flagellar biosynthesis protein, FliO